MAVNHEAKPRDADRSRTAILEAAERLFAARGFEGASLAEIAAAAGVSRATPSYFFGSKQQLYVAALERVFRDRQSAVAVAFEPLRAWVRDGGGPQALRTALEGAADGYIGFLLSRPAFVRLLQHEDLAGGQQLRVTRRERNAISLGFEALQASAARRGLGSFRAADAVLVFVSLTFSPLTQQSTFMAVLGRDLNDPTVRRRHVQLVADQLLHLLGAG